MKDDIFKEKVGKFSVREIGRTAKERKAGSLGYAEALLIAYNKKMKSPLRWSKLYASKKSMPGDEFFEDKEDEDIDVNEEPEADEV